ncbi:ssDNA-binding protein [Lachnoanaerobaculum sp. OBRC5-5]|uniref:ssDNA-binding protein n=1 Tax=Lachnoanaerobaculum sp. OBRC5-5 TaxID=936595 RepID=UPI001FA6C7CC
MGKCKSRNSKTSTNIEKPQVKPTLVPENDKHPDINNKYFVNSNSTPTLCLLTASLKPILTCSKVYSGIHNCISIRFYAFNCSGMKELPVDSTT